MGLSQPPGGAAARQPRSAGERALPRAGRGASRSRRPAPAPCSPAPASGVPIFP